MNCYICNKKTHKILEDKTKICITSEGELVKSKKKIFFCNNCQHLQKKNFTNLKDYYSKDYKLNLSKKNQDSIIQVKNKILTRQQYQKTIFKKKIRITKANILDFGCGKGDMAKILKSNSPNFNLYLYDIGKQYLKYWKKFVKKENYSVDKIPNYWNRKFDIITSFYSLEHSENLNNIFLNFQRILKDNGLIYIVVPNVLSNIADFLVIDHINHFSKVSMQLLAGKYFFKVINIDNISHEGAYIFILQKTKKKLVFKKNKIFKKQILKIKKKWEIKLKIIQKKINFITEKFIIYGAGFYGRLIFSLIPKKKLKEFNGFIDRNYFLKGVKIGNKQVYNLERIKGFKNIFVGLNPKNSKKIMKSTLKKKYKYFKINYI